MARILVVEDEGPTRSLVHIVLETLMGHEVREATNVSEAIGVLQEWTPHVVVTDVRLPDATGTALGGLVRDDPRFQATELLYLTAYDLPQTRRGESVLRKPFDLQDLESTVGELAERASELERVSEGGQEAGQGEEAPWMERWTLH